MGMLDDQLAIDARTFIDTDAFGEPIVYTPFTGGDVPGTPVTINAVVHRRLPQGVAEATQGFAPSIEVWIANDAAVGITNVNLGDTITVAWKVGDTPGNYKIIERVEQDHGAWHVRIR